MLEIGLSHVSLQVELLNLVVEGATLGFDLLDDPLSVPLLIVELLIGHEESIKLLFVLVIRSLSSFYLFLYLCLFFT